VHLSTATPRVLDVLRDGRVTATFFLVGDRALLDAVGSIELLGETVAEEIRLAAALPDAGCRRARARVRWPGTSGSACRAGATSSPSTRRAPLPCDRRCRAPTHEDHEEASEDRRHVLGDDRQRDDHR
jgi:peptidoglycan/xylan/chitin deacetylase (PgdA/CDA1 family)